MNAGTRSSDSPPGGVVTLPKRRVSGVKPGIATAEADRVNRSALPYLRVRRRLLPVSDCRLGRVATHRTSRRGSTPACNEGMTNHGGLPWNSLWVCWSYG